MYYLSQFSWRLQIPIVKVRKLSHGKFTEPVIEKPGLTLGSLPPQPSGAPAIGSPSRVVSHLTLGMGPAPIWDSANIAEGTSGDWKHPLMGTVDSEVLTFLHVSIQPM